ncbi:hypothetical protein [Flavobacterium psychrotolerans]|uniref:Uncharacterized protein n=1 Tax=Flavobacterium psychrotolerans TaxID=2169410 RepID=A0A2U1JG73_9FLAO|nr:hypothetical protein [Flavobacterium psychrotolerans]PWA03984.1 hypothetical protein DB895_13420 [Flavobacterium psychrotolerans]
MCRFKIQNVNDDTIIEIISMNIDNENNILAVEETVPYILSISEFKDKILGTNSDNTGESKEATYKIIK